MFRFRGIESRNSKFAAFDAAKPRNVHLGNNAPVAQMDRAAASGAVGREFESLRAHHFFVSLISPPNKIAECMVPITPCAASVALCIPMPKIHIPTPLRQYVGKQADVEVSGSTVGGALSDLVSKHPDLRRHLYTDDGKLRAFVNVYLNDEDVRYLQKEATAVKDADSISIVPSIAGGTAATSC